MVVQVPDGRAQLGQKCPQAGRCGTSHRCIRDEHGGVGARGEDGLVVREGFHQVPQFASDTTLTARGNASSWRRNRSVDAVSGRAGMARRNGWYAANDRSSAIWWTSL